MEPGSAIGNLDNVSIVYKLVADRCQDMWVYALVKGASVGDFLLQGAGSGDPVLSQDAQDALLSDLFPVIRQNQPPVSQLMVYIYIVVWLAGGWQSIEI